MVPGEAVCQNEVMARPKSFQYLVWILVLGFVVYFAISTSERHSPRVSKPEDQPPPKMRDELDGEVDYVFDGDTLSLQQDDRQHRIRLAGIDAPERHQPFADDAREYLRQLCAGRRVHVVVLGTDRFDRILGDVYCEGVWVNGQLVGAGYAWNWSRGHRADELQALQQQARQQQLGLWASDTPVEPWKFRRGSRAGDGRPPAFVPGT